MIFREVRGQTFIAAASELEGIHWVMAGLSNHCPSLKIKSTLRWREKCAVTDRAFDSGVVLVICHKLNLSSCEETSETTHDAECEQIMSCASFCSEGLAVGLTRECYSWDLHHWYTATAKWKLFESDGGEEFQLVALSLSFNASTSFHGNRGEVWTTFETKARTSA